MIRLFGHDLDVPAVILAAVELGGLFVIALVLEAVLTGTGFAMTGYDKFIMAAVIVSVSGIGMTAVGLYNREHFLHWDDELSRAVVVIPALAAALLTQLAVYDYLILGPKTGHPHGPYLVCIGAMAAFLPLFALVRWSLLRFVDKTGTFTRRVLVLGSGHRAGKIEQLCVRHLDRSFTVVGYVRLGSPPPDEARSYSNDRRGAVRRNDFWLNPEGIADLCAQQKVDELVVATKERRGLPVRELLVCKLAGVTMSEYATFWEREARQIDLDEITPSWLLFSDGFRVGRVRSFVKRLFDISVSFTLLTLSLPVTLLTALLIKMESPGPIFYRQERVGLGGKSYDILKFRSMRVDAEKEGPRWAAKNDSRVTRVGAVIRKIRIDEIPQVINVLKGEMAFVGPRPERPVFVSALAEKIPYYMERHSIKPGITGWAQINYPYGATEEDARMKLSYDLYYAKNGNLFLDILIIVQTVKVLLWNSGAR